MTDLFAKIPAAAACFERAARALGGSLDIRPIVTGEDWMQPADIVGQASTYEEALQLLAGKGYEIIPDDDGGCHEPSPDDDDRAFLVTVKALPGDLSPESAELATEMADLREIVSACRAYPTPEAQKLADEAESAINR